MHIKTITAAFIVGISLLVAGCQDPKSSTPDPKPDLFQPFDVSKKGQKAVFEFWTKAEDSNEGNALILGVQAMDEKSVSSEQMNFMRKLQYELPFQVTVQKLVGNNWVDSGFKGFKNPKDLEKIESNHFMGNAEVYGRFFAFPADIAVARIDRHPALSKYRVTLETLEDNANFPTIKMEAFIWYMSYGGK